MRKATLTSLVLALFYGGVVPGNTAHAAPGDSTCDLTQEDGAGPYLVFSADDLLEIEDCGLNGSYLQMNDIGPVTQPASPPSVRVANEPPATGFTIFHFPFTGTFNGQGFEIDVNIIDNTGPGRHAALFGTASGAKFLNIRLTGQVKVGAGITSSVGSLIGEVLGGSVEITDVHSAVSVEYLGGNYGSGLIGNASSGTTNITRSSFTGSFSGPSLSSEVGGFASRFRGSITDSYVRATIAGGGKTGGFYGYRSSTISISRSYSASRVEPRPAGGDIGGITGTGAPDNATQVFWNNLIGPTEPLPGVTSLTGATGASTAEMTSIDIYRNAGWLITEFWEEYAAGENLWGICENFNEGYPYLLSQLTEEEATDLGCVEPVPAAVNQSTSPPSGDEKRASSPAIHLDLQVTVGQQISGAPVVVGGEGLAGGSDYSLVVRSTPQTVDSGKASSLGNFSKRVSMPALAPGSHTLTLTAVAPDGSTLSLVQGFTVGADGTVTAMGSPAGSTGSALAATGSDQLVMLGSVGLAMLMVVAGVSAVAASRSQRTHLKG